MKTLLASLVALVSLAWAWDLLVSGGASGGSLPWIARQEALYLSGLISISMMSLTMFLASRPVWLEGPLGGLDRMYRSHKWAGILAVGFAALHWLIEMTSDILKATVGREGRIPQLHYTGLLEVMRDLGEDMGEWAIYAVLVMLALTLWKRFPYRAWRFLHQAMPVLYLMLAFHAALLAPPDYWRQPVGWLLGLLLCAGVAGSIHSLAGRIGRKRQVSGKITAIERTANDIVAVHCLLAADWRGHHPGQFAFISFDPKEGPHPFTIASADHGDRVISFQIKALGDYTRSLGNRLQVGQAVKVEGPYGRFELSRQHPQAQQIWIAGGIGITPFLAWLEALQSGPAEAVADLHYCTRDRDSDPFVARLETLCATLPGIRLQVHGAQQGEFLTAEHMAATKRSGVGTGAAEIWFCGPQGLAKSLKQGLAATWRGKFDFHQEAFEMR